jgi:hypothetical protein
MLVACLDLHFDRLSGSALCRDCDCDSDSDGDGDSDSLCCQTADDFEFLSGDVWLLSSPTERTSQYKTWKPVYLF